MFCCLLLITFNVESKCNCKRGNSTVATLKFKKTLLTMSITSSSIVDSRCSMSYRLIFCPCSSYVVSSIPSLYLRLLCLGTIPPYATSCKVPISLTIELSTMFKWNILKTFMTCLHYQGQSHCCHSKVEHLQSIVFLDGWWMLQIQCPPHLSVRGHSYLKYHELARRYWQQCLLAFFFSHIWKFCITPCTNSEF